MTRFLTLLAVLPLALTACSSPAPAGPVQVDRAIVPTGATSTNVLTPERLLIEGSAAWTRMSVGDLMQRRAVTDADRQRAEQMIASGAYLGDDTHVIQLTPAAVTEGMYQAGTAYLLNPFSPEAAPQPFQMQLTVDLEGGPGASVGLSLELRSPGSTETGGIGELLVTLMDPGVNTSAQLTVSQRGPRDSDVFEPVASVPLASRDWRGAHRLLLNYAPGDLSIALDGEPLMTAPVRLSRPAGPVYVGAFAPTPTMGVTLLDWTFSPR